MIPDVTKLMPKLLIDNLNTDGQALIDKINSYIASWKNELLIINYWNDPVICPDVQLDDLGFLLAAEILSSDTPRQKRVKIWNAIQGHRKRSLWEEDIKIRIDAVTGLNAVLYSNINNDDWIMGGDGNIPSGYYWGTMGVDGVDLNLGLALLGTGLEYQIKGNIYIDLGATVTSAVLDLIEINIQNIIPAYIVIVLGYTVGTTFYELRTI